VVIGTISGKGRPLAGVDVVIDDDARARSAADGAYRVRTEKVGFVRILIRAVGFQPVVRKLLLVGGDTVRSDFVLDPVAQELDPVEVRVAGAVAAGRMAGFEERRVAGFGRFFTRETLAAREQSTLADVIRMTPGLQLVRRPDRCGGGFSVATGRGGVVQWQDWMACNNVPMQPACYFAIYLDGARYWMPGSREPPDVNQFTVHGLEAIELYRGPAETPMQYQQTGAACGVLLLWSRLSP
jgi:hypothetical protein